MTVLIRKGGREEGREEGGEKERGYVLTLPPGEPIAPSLPLGP